ncbi:hypothetical protein A2U01_0111766, partial [Trifolium medium]|nr:hypothetical protein [Trifolium medium]
MRVAQECMARRAGLDGFSS